MALLVDYGILFNWTPVASFIKCDNITCSIGVSAFGFIVLACSPTARLATLFIRRFLYATRQRLSFYLIKCRDTIMVM